MSSLIGSPVNEDAAYAVVGIDAATATDQELLACLRDKYRRFKVEKEARKLESLEINAGLASLDPNRLPACFVMSPEMRTRVRETRLGRWKEKLCDFTAIRSDGKQERYAGMRATMEFVWMEGTPSDWVMHQYYLLDTYNVNDLYFEEEMVLCKVFKRESSLHRPVVHNPIPRYYQASSPIPRYYQASSSSLEDDSSCYYRMSPRREDKLNSYIKSFSDCLLGEDEPSSHERSGKRTRSCAHGGKSDVWKNFTKVHTGDPDVVYAICHCCDRVFNAPSKNGTSHLRRHRKKCSSKGQWSPWHHANGRINSTDAYFAGVPWEPAGQPPPASVLENYGG
ncbi:hypothetical protein ACP4OV_023161 [Aristida adscensionis]